jgi:hypothetical protein
MIDERKLREYLLSESHPIGRFKATFFRALGYSPALWPRLEQDLRTHATTSDATPTAETEYGQKFEVHGTVVGPNGREATIVSVWIVLRGETDPRLVTVYPGGPR